MKESDQDRKGWFPLPWVELSSGKPTQFKEGLFFKIRNFKTVEIRSVDVAGPKTFRKATVLVFSSVGEILLEKTFPVVVSVAPIPLKSEGLETEALEPAKVFPGSQEIQEKSDMGQRPVKETMR